MSSSHLDLDYAVEGFEPKSSISEDQTGFPFAFRMLVKTPLLAGFSFVSSFDHALLKCRFSRISGETKLGSEHSGAARFIRTESYKITRLNNSF